MSHGTIRTASRRLHAWRWRSLSTSADIPSHAPPYRPESPTSRSSARQDTREDLRVFHPRMIFVRPWDGIPTMAHAFAIVRDIERRFGRIQEFVVPRDTDVLSSCSPFLHATFSQPEYADAIPSEGKVIQVVAPNVDRKRDGGIGLDDLHVYLNPELRERALSDRESAIGKEAEWGPPEEGQVMDVKLERTRLRDPPAVLDHSFGFRRRGPPHLNNPMRTRELAHAIHAFGGFVDQTSYSPGTRTSMQALVSRWSRMVKLPPQPHPEPAQESAVDANPIEKLEEPVASEEEIPWTPFEIESAAPEPALSLPSVPFISPTSNPKSALPLTRRIAPKVTSVEPKLSKKQRMRNAARLAGAMASEKLVDDSEEPETTASVSEAGADQTNIELGHDAKASEEENKVAARKWWNFLTGGKS